MRSISTRFTILLSLAFLILKCRILHHCVHFIFFSGFNHVKGLQSSSHRVRKLFSFHSYQHCIVNVIVSAFFRSVHVNHTHIWVSMFIFFIFYCNAAHIKLTIFISLSFNIAFSSLSCCLQLLMVKKATIISAKIEFFVLCYILFSLPIYTNDGN